MSVDLIYKLNGDIDEGINVYDLSPILLSFGRLITEAHKTLYPETKEIAVNIKPFSKGSFEINLLVFAQDHIQDLLAFLSSDTGKLIAGTLTYLGFVQSTSGISVLQLISWLKGKAKRIERLDSGEVRYYSDDNTSITVSKEVSNLYQNCTIQQNIYNGVGKPLEIEGVSSVESYIKQNEATTKVVYSKEIVPAIKDYATSQLPTENEESPVDNIRRIWVHPKRISVEGEKNNWSFRTGQSDILTANVSDEKFLAGIKDCSIRLSQQDRLLVEVHEKQSIKDGEITSSNEIVKVVDYEKAPQSREFKFDD